MIRNYKFNNRIYLIGYMGCGKTTVGRRLAEKLDFQFVDVDLFIENRQRKTVSEIFAEKGEETFRMLEHKTLEELSLFENVVISTGGGAPCFHNNMELMNKSGLTVYLKVTPKELINRLKNGQNKRPLLKGKTTDEMLSFVTENVNKRSFYYTQAALVFDAEINDINYIVNNLILHLTTK